MNGIVPLKTSCESCGAYSYSLERKPVAPAKESLLFWGNRIEVKNLELNTT